MYEDLGSGAPLYGSAQQSGPDFQAYFVYRFKEHLMRKRVGSKAEFVFRMLLLYNWDKVVNYIWGMVMKYYYVYLGRHVVRVKNLVSYKTDVTLTDVDSLYLLTKTYLAAVNDTNVNFAGSRYHSEAGIHIFQSSGNGPVDIKSNKTLEEIEEIITNLYLQKGRRTIELMNFDPVAYRRDSLLRDASQHIMTVDYDSTFLSEKVEETIRYFTRNYRKMRSFYRKNRVMYKTNILLYGPPGTGKTSFIRLLASELCRNIMVIDLKRINSKKTLLSTITAHSKSSVVVLEELDCLIGKIGERRGAEASFEVQQLSLMKNMVESSRNNSPGSQEAPVDDITLDDFLDALDGLNSAEDSVIVMTTNHIDKIDDAFKRDGRMNYVIEMKLCSRYQFKNIFQSYYGRDLDTNLLEEFPEEHYSTATVTQTILRSYHHLDLESLTTRELFDKTLQLINEANQAQERIRSPPVHILTSDDESL